MFEKSRYLGEYVMIATSALLMLGLFDSNPWWKVLLYSLFATPLNLALDQLGVQKSWPLSILAFAQGIAASLLAYLFGLTPFFRTTFGTLVGFALTIALGEQLLTRFFWQRPTKN